MKLEEKQLSKQFARVYVTNLIRLWRSRYSVRLSLDGKNLPSDSELAAFISVTPAAFSRISTGVVTCSFPVFCRILCAMIDTLGEAAAESLQRNAYYSALKKYYYGNS